MMFEVKKTYRTQRGHTAQVCNDHGGSHNLPLRIVVLGNATWATRDGAFQFCTDVDRMLPGAIEDEKPEALPQQVGNNVDTTAIFKVLASHQEQIDTARREIALLASGMNDHTKQITELDQAALKAQCNGHQYLSDHLDTLRKRVEELMHKVGKIEVAAVCDPIIKARESYAAACTAGADRAKQHPKVRGWLNVYDFYTAWHPTRSDADLCESPNRRACIKVPDFTDGEGL